MVNTKNPREPFNPATMIVTAIAIFGVALGAAALLQPAAAAPRVSDSGAAGGETGPLPGRIANQTGEIELMPDLYY